MRAFFLSVFILFALPCSANTPRTCSASRVIELTVDRVESTWVILEISPEQWVELPLAWFDRRPREGARLRLLVCVRGRVAP